MDDSKLFYIQLKEQRESNDISLEEISDFTKIDIKYLGAIEEGNFSCLPNVYMRLFLRSYCQYIKADTDKALNDYEFHTLGAVSTDHSPATSLKENNIEPENLINEEDLNLPPVTKSQIITIIATVIILGFIFYLISSITDSSEEIVLNTNNEKIVEEAIDEKIKIYSLIPNEEPLTSSEFEDNLISKNSTILDTEFPPYVFTLQPLTKTKIHIDNNGKIINKVIAPEEYISLEIDSVIKFDLWSASHVECKLNDIDLNDFFGIEDRSIRGSFETKNQKLYYQIHSQIQ